ncbi:ClpXP protease specificity-enhancing factor [uncultured Aquimonas sp.]|jgi:stringent starvation protein B|uniref:ClpXP protease specificity-enhancing factor n=1 Tax=uncultured Aquimonas sp. TaxID=385483 RepID=UPI00086BC0C5|nr:ClpXP protease specificity-enhancing factor [uncultured Aquimonas sp.]ODU44799.1 MAG: ClpXP protease specificity-enhancing factor [Xanthomonadaceae bacterium SCN 69-123]
MSSNRPYLLRAMYDWITDNGLTPYLLVDARQPGVQVPAFAIKDGKVVLNIAMRAVDALDLGDDRIRFQARFSGASHALSIPLVAVEAIYAQENGQGMMLPADDIEASLPADPVEAEAKAEEPPLSGGDEPPRRSHLRVIK